MKTIAFIPARGGSKRLPRKNIKDFLSKPIIAYTIEAAFESKLFDEVIVSTEDAEIAKISKSYGANIDDRPNELSSDGTTIDEVCLEYLNRKANIDIHALAVLYATAPMRNSEDIKGVVNLLSEDCQFAMGATICKDAHQMMLYHDGDIEILFPQLINYRPDRCGQYCLNNGSTYAVNAEAFKKQKTFFGKKLKAYLMPHSRSIDIDTQKDFDLALFYAKKGWNE